MTTNDPVAVPLHGMSVAEARPAASRDVLGQFLHGAPHLAEARTAVPAMVEADKFDNTPDFAPTQAPVPRGL